MKIFTRGGGDSPTIERLVVQYEVFGEEELLRAISLATHETADTVCEAHGAFENRFTSERARRGSAARKFREAIGLDALEERWEESKLIAEAVLLGRKAALRELEAETGSTVETVFEGRSAIVAEGLVMRGIALLCMDHGHDENILRSIIEYPPAQE